MSIKSIPLKTWEVQAILENRKSTLRRVVKMDRHSIYKVACAAGRWSETFAGEIPDEVAEWYAREMAKQPYRPGDILWVREKWRMQNYGFDYDTRTYQGQELQYRADLTDGEDECYGRRGGCAPCRWSPSIHMPREAARLFLRVKSVRVERLQTMDCAGALAEGCDGRCECPSSGAPGSLSCVTRDFSLERFEVVWDSTLPKKQNKFKCAEGAWSTNPWVWVVEFERCEKPEGWL